MRSSRKIPNLIRPPLPDEFEVSLFGPGVGECVVVHLGSGEWMVVDSCTDRKTGNPVALDYLDQIGVNVSKAVKLIVITHWHNDHMRGLARILKAAASAELVCSAALKSIEFQDLLGASLADPPAEIGVDEFRGTFEVLLERGQGRAEAVGPKWAMANMCVFRSTQATVHALSPSHATFSLSLREIGASYQVSPRPRRRMVAQTANEVSVVLWVEFGDLRALLGADLENAKDKRTGWLAIVDSSDRPQGRAHQFLSGDAAKWPAGGGVHAQLCRRHRHLPRPPARCRAATECSRATAARRRHTR